MKNNTFSDNSADSGAVLVIDYSTALRELVGYFGQNKSPPDISNNSFADNRAFSSASAMIIRGIPTTATSEIVQNDINALTNNNRFFNNTVDRSDSFYPENQSEILITCPYGESLTVVNDYVMVCEVCKVGLFSSFNEFGSCSLCPEYFECPGNERELLLKPEYWRPGGVNLTGFNQNLDVYDCPPSIRNFVLKSQGLNTPICVGSELCSYST